MFRPNAIIDRRKALSHLLAVKLEDESDCRIERPGRIHFDAISQKLRNELLKEGLIRRGRDKSGVYVELTQEGIAKAMLVHRISRKD